MRKGAHRATIDPELTRQLELAEPDRPVEAVLSLRPAATATAPSEVTTKAAVELLLERSRQQEPAGLHDYTVFPNLGAFAVRASGSFVRHLIDQPEIATATANRQPQELLIRPVSSRPAGGPGESD
jgi:hypothetical protein